MGVITRSSEEYSWVGLIGGGLTGIALGIGLFVPMPHLTGGMAGEISQPLLLPLAQQYLPAVANFAASLNPVGMLLSFVGSAISIPLIGAPIGLILDRFSERQRGDEKN